MKAVIRVRPALCALLLAAIAVPAAAQQYPAKPIRMLVGFPMGGGADIMARLLAPGMAEALGQPIVVDNRPGAGSAVASELAAKAPADGHTLVMIGSSHAVNAAFNPKLPYRPAADFSGIVLVATAPVALTAHSSVPAKTLKELIALAQAKPGALAYGSAGVGGINQLAAELLKYMGKFNIVHVPYKGVAQALPALLGGEVQLMFSSLPSVVGQIKQGRIKAIAVTSAKRSGAAPDIPTVAESGLPGYEASSWFGLLAPARTPTAVINRLNAEASKIIAMPNIQEQLVRTGADPAGSTPAQLDAHLKAEVTRWTTVVREAGIQP